jgi:hypothetical protein
MKASSYSKKSPVNDDAANALTTVGFRSNDGQTGSQLLQSGNSAQNARPAWSMSAMAIFQQLSVTVIRMMA